MVRVVIAGTFLLAISSPTAASQWVHRPLNETARSSDLIVVGRLTDIRPVEGPLLMPAARHDYFEGTIEVEQLFWPEGKAPKQVTLRWSVPGMRVSFVSGSDEFDYRRHKGQRVLWLLQAD